VLLRRGRVVDPNRFNYPAALVTFSQTLRALALAPLAGVLVITSMSLRVAGSHALSIAPFLAIRVAPLCYVAEALFVVPVIAFWPSARRPSYIGAAAWGFLVAWAMTALFAWSIDRSFRTTDIGLEGLIMLSTAGMASGLLYARLVR
jgi:hypothetical protein